MDREFDDNEYFSTISLQGDDFVIRAKKSRSVDNITDSKVNKTRLIDSNFSNQYIHKLQKAIINLEEATGSENIHEGIDNNLSFDFL